MIGLIKISRSVIKKLVAKLFTKEAKRDLFASLVNKLQIANNNECV